jgi:hypothetical protein
MSASNIFNNGGLAYERLESGFSSFIFLMRGWTVLENGCLYIDSNVGKIL